MNSLRKQILPLLICGTFLLHAGQVADAQHIGPDGRYFPLNQRTQPGVASYWAGLEGNLRGPYVQPVKVILPTQGKVTFYNGSLKNAQNEVAPAQVGLSVAHVYRFRIAEMPEFPNIELYPTVELIDHLHPPNGEKHQFPVPLIFTREEIEAVLKNQLMTKVVYLEQPQLATPIELTTPLTVTEIPPKNNLLAEADQRGRPVAIIRLGARLPDAHRPDPTFFGVTPPVYPSVPKPAK